MPSERDTSSAESSYEESGWESAGGTTLIVRRKDKSDDSTAKSSHSDAPTALDGAPIPSQQWNRYKKVKRRRFKLLRSLALADFITLANGACGVSSIFFCLNFLEHQSMFHPYIWGAFICLPLALIFDILDGSVARWRKNASPYGADLDSLADVVSFSVAPAVLGFTLGLRGLWDCIILSYFVCCGIGRLARYNVTSAELSDSSTGKVKYYQGFPVPTSLLLVLILYIAYSQGAVYENIWFGAYRTQFIPGTFHPFSLAFFFMGCAMISEWPIPKP